MAPCQAVKRRAWQSFFSNQSLELRRTPAGLFTARSLSRHPQPDETVKPALKAAMQAERCCQTRPGFSAGASQELLGCLTRVAP